MSQRTYTVFAAFIFALQAAAHVVRSILQTPATIGDFHIPAWWSYVAVVFLGLLSLMGLRAVHH